MGVLCCHFRPKMFSPGDHVRYHSRTLGAHVLATVVGPSPNGTQFCHIRYIRPGGVTPVDHESAQLSRLEAVAVESPKSPESPDVTPMSPQPQTPAQPTQPTSLVIYVRKSGSLRIWCLRRSRWLPPRQEERLPPSQEESQLVWLCKRALKRLPNQPRAPLPPPPRPVQHTPCLSCKPSMCNNSKCVILVPRSSLPFLWILNNICVG